MRLTAASSGPILTALTLSLPLACSGGGPMVSPAPSSVSSSPRAPGSRVCQVAARERASVPALLAEGRLDRTARVLDRADTFCPESAPQTWAVRVATLAELGRGADVRKLADTIEASKAASPAARAAAAKARQAIAALEGRQLDGRALAYAGLAAQDAGDRAQGQRLIDRALVALGRARG